MMIGTREVIHESHPYAVGTVPPPFLLAASGEASGTPPSNRRQEARIEEQKPCTYELCESVNEEAVVIQQGEVYSLNRSAHGVLILMGYLPRLRQLLELHIPESRWRRSLNLYEVQWTKPVHVESHGDLFLVGCRLTFGPSRYVAF